VFLGMSYSIGVHAGVEIAWLFCDQLFASFQVRGSDNLTQTYG
jgi:parathyroid hormone receptor 1